MAKKAVRKASATKSNVSKTASAVGKPTDTKPSRASRKAVSAPPSKVVAFLMHANGHYYYQTSCCVAPMPYHSGLLVTSSPHGHQACPNGVTINYDIVMDDAPSPLRTSKRNDKIIGAMDFCSYCASKPEYGDVSFSQYCDTVRKLGTFYLLKNGSHGAALEGMLYWIYELTVDHFQYHIATYIGDAATVEHTQRPRVSANLEARIKKYQGSKKKSSNGPTPYLHCANLEYRTYNSESTIWYSLDKVHFHV